MSDQFKALVLNQQGEDFTREVKSIDKSFLKHGDVTIKVDYSDLNFKDGKEITKRKFFIDAYVKGLKVYKIRTTLSLFLAAAIVLFICFGNMPSSFIDGRLAGKFDDGTISAVMYLIDMFSSFSGFLASFG